MTPKAIRLLCVGLPDSVTVLMREVLTQPVIESVGDAASWESLFSAENLEFDAVICGPNPFGMQSIEIAQSCASFLPGAPVYFVTYSPGDLTVRDLLKNGFRQTFLLPGDKQLFHECLSLAERQATGKGKVIQRPVSLIDFDAGEPLDFEVSIYLRINKKYVRIVNEGKSLDQAKIEKFKSYQVDRVYIDAAKVDRFYKYSADKLRRMNQTQDGISESERLDKMQQTLRKIIHSIFDNSADAGFEQGRQIFEDTTKVVSEMIGTTGAKNIQEELAAALRQSPETSSRASRVSTFAALFEMSMGLKMTQQAAIAGLFLDIGLAQLPDDLQTKSYAAMNPEEKKLYASHPLLSLNILQAKRMAVPPEVRAAILQHHEKFDGTGFPNQTPGHKLSQLSQIVAAADRVETLVFGQDKPMAMDVVIDQLRSERICSPEVLLALQKLIAPKTKAA